MQENAHAPMPIGKGAGRPTFWSQAWFLIELFQARMRFVVILAGMAFVLGNWDKMHAYYEKWARPAETAGAPSSDSEFFCPMHPRIVRDNDKEKCPICFMPLSKRKRGAADAAPLPAGTLNRVQLSPYRILLAGVQTTLVEPLPLVREINAVGFVEFDERRQAQIAARVKGRIEKLVVNVTGQMVAKGDVLATLYSPDLYVTLQNLRDAETSSNQQLLRIAKQRLELWNIGPDDVEEATKAGTPTTFMKIRSPISGHVIRKYQVEGKYVEEGTPLYDVADLSTVWIEAQFYETDLAFLKIGVPVEAMVPAFPERSFKGRISFVQPHLDQATRTISVRFNMDNPDHQLRPGMYAQVRLKLLMAESPMFAGKRPASAKEPGSVLAVPEGSVIDTGREKIIYRETAPGTYDAVAVTLGPRCGNNYPMLEGLAAGDRVVTTGSFLIDAETRLNPAAGSIYLAKSNEKAASTAAMSVQPSQTADDEAVIQANRSKLSAKDRALADAQDYCPINADTRLGAMGAPLKILLKGQPVLLCCPGCEAKARQKADETLAKVKTLRERPRTQPSVKIERAPVVQAVDAEEETDIRAERAKLEPGDRELADAQEFCVIRGDSRLGSMGKPVRIELEGKPVLLCCERCEKKARANPAQALSRQQELKARAKPAAAPHDHGRMHE